MAAHTTFSPNTVWTSASRLKNTNKQWQWNQIYASTTAANKNGWMGRSQPKWPWPLTDLTDEPLLAAADVVQSFQEEGYHLARDELFAHQLCRASTAEVQIITRFGHVGCHRNLKRRREKKGEATWRESVRKNGVPQILTHKRLKKKKKKREKKKRGIANFSGTIQNVCTFLCKSIWRSNKMIVKW